MTSLKRASVYALLLLGLCACGGGGGDAGTPAAGALSSNYTDTQTPASPDTPATSNAPAHLGKSGSLLISEVASNYYSDDVAWFEVYNPNAAPVALSDYTLNASYIDTGSS